MANFQDSIIVAEMAYGTTDTFAQTLIIAYPDDTATPKPAIIHFHGGGWFKGQASRGTAEHFARNGYVGISVNYRLSGEAIFPAAVHDGKAAIRWARAHAEEYGIDPERIGVFGGSAGGHLAALIGLSANDVYLEGDGPHSEYSSTVQAVVDNYGPTDFSKMNDAPGNMDHDSPQSPESRFLGGPVREMDEQVRRANPITYVDPSDPPILMFHGREDMSVPFHQSELLLHELQRKGVKVRLIPVDHAGHGFKPSPPEATIFPSCERISALTLEWFDWHLGMKR